jgi:hypothetical protein
MAGTEFSIPIWDGSPGAIAGSTPFGIYDADSLFQTDGPKFADYAARHLGYPVADVELQSGSFYLAFESAISEYSRLVNQANIKDNLLYLQGSPTTTDVTQRLITTNLGQIVALADDYGSEAGVGGNIQYRTGSISVAQGQQRYDLNALVRDELHPDEQIEIKRVFHNAPPAITRYFDPFLDTGLGSQNLLEQFGMGNFSPAVTFLMMPTYADLLRLQAIELNDMVRKSAYSFNIVNNEIELFPLPTENFTLHFRYIIESDRSNPLRHAGDTNNKVSDTSNVPYDFIEYGDINSVGKQWIWKYGMALSMEMLGLIRSKYSSVPIPNAEVSLNGPELISNAQTLKEQLITEMREDLEGMSRKAQLESSAQESEFLQQQLSRVPLPIWIA